ncbi:hypothetical protein [Chromohalobacter sp. 296-RDG]|uniref:hypothetical protein n=1 Tax=Chromohalobacter sp. 296-RDG TaxID=2994062 RepID=UPI002469BF34|nr:hypothetical protein [Chromohalobacter sp. 296-RDG]
MLSRESLTRVFGMMSPASQQKARQQSEVRGVGIETVVHESIMAKGGDAMYALRRKPELRVVRGGRA